MEQFNNKVLIKKIESFLNHEITKDELSSWAAQIHYSYEKGEIKFKGNENKIFAILVNLTYVNKDDVAPTSEDLKEIIKGLLE